MTTPFTSSQFLPPISTLDGVLARVGANSIQDLVFKFLVALLSLRISVSATNWIFSKFTSSTTDSDTFDVPLSPSSTDSDTIDGPSSPSLTDIDSPPRSPVTSFILSAGLFTIFVQYLLLKIFSPAQGTKRDIADIKDVRSICQFHWNDDGCPQLPATTNAKWPFVSGKSLATDVARCNHYSQCAGMPTERIERLFLTHETGLQTLLISILIGFLFAFAFEGSKRVLAQEKEEVVRTPITPPLTPHTLTRPSTPSAPRRYRVPSN